MIENTAPRSSFLGAHAFPKITTDTVATIPARRRRLDRESGQAIEKLGHAIQYLADEFALDCLNPAQRLTPGNNSRIEAIQLLMAFNRQIYMNCPEVPTLSERLKAFFGMHRA